VEDFHHRIEVWSDTAVVYVDADFAREQHSVLEHHRAHATHRGQFARARRTKLSVTQRFRIGDIFARVEEQVFLAWHRTRFDNRGRRDVVALERGER
jgi:hypothetical protein